MKPGSQQLASAAAAAVEALVIAAGGGPEDPVTDIISVIASSQTYNLLNICGAPDPGDPGLTLADILLAADLTSPVLADPAIKKVTQWFVHMMWPSWCDCANGTSAPPSTTAPLPTGTANPGLPTGSLNPPCWNKTSSYQVPAGTATSAPVDFSLQVLPQTTSVTVVPGGTNWPTTAWVMPAGVSNVQSIATLHENVATFGMSQTVEFFNNTGAMLTNVTLAAWPPLATITTAVPVPANAYSWHVFNVVDTTPHNYTNQWSFACPGNPSGQLSTPCCPPDPLLEGKLNQIYQLLQAVYSAAGGLATYKKSTVHSGLTSSGTIGSAGLIGIEVDITAAPATKTQPGNPPYIWDMGWLSLLTGDGMIDEKRLTRTHQLWLPQLGGLATTWGYYFNPGVTATITELIP
jgi:hypothetical protein